MKATWHSAEATLFDREHREGTVSVWVRYDLGSWSFGLRFEHDPCWYELYVDLGPVGLSICYWRHWPTPIHT